MDQPGLRTRGVSRRDDGKHAKYLNSPEGELFHKSELLYGVHEARPALARGAPAVVRTEVEIGRGDIEKTRGWAFW